MFDQSSIAGICPTIKHDNLHMCAPMRSLCTAGFLRIFSEEGLLHLWAPGLVATWLRAMTQTGLRVGLYPRRGALR